MCFHAGFLTDIGPRAHKERSLAHLGRDGDMVAALGAPDEHLLGGSNPAFHKDDRSAARVALDALRIHLGDQAHDAQLLHPHAHLQHVRRAALAVVHALEERGHLADVFAEDGVPFRRKRVHERRLPAAYVALHDTHSNSRVVAHLSDHNASCSRVETISHLALKKGFH